MKGETKRYDGKYGAITVAKRDIGGNTYLVVVKPIDDRQHSHAIRVHADETNGVDDGFPAFPDQTYRTEYDSIIRHEVKHSDNLSSEISRAVNYAVGQITKKMEEAKANEDAVLGALEANATVHEGDDG